MEDKIPNFSLPAQSFPSVRCQSNWIQFNSRMVSEGIKHLLVSGCILTVVYVQAFSGGGRTGCFSSSARVSRTAGPLV